MTRTLLEKRWLVLHRLLPGARIMNARAPHGDNSLDTAIRLATDLSEEGLDRVLARPEAAE